MSCTCAKKQYPCPVHAPGHLPVPETVQHVVFVIRLYQRLATNEKWFVTVVKDAITVFTSSDMDSRHDAVREAIDFLDSQNQKPKEVCKV